MLPRRPLGSADWGKVKGLIRSRVEGTSTMRIRSHPGCVRAELISCRTAAGGSERREQQERVWGVGVGRNQQHAIAQHSHLRSTNQTHL